MKILLVSGSFPPMKCGVGDYTGRLAENLSAIIGTQVAVLTDRSARSEMCHGDGCRIFPVVGGWQWSDLRSIMRATRMWNPGIVHVQYPTQGYGRKMFPWTLPALFHLQGYPVVQTWHEYYPRGSWLNLANALLPGGLIAVRPNYRETMPRWYRLATRHKMFAFIPNASVIPPVCLSDTERAEIRARYGTEKRRLLVYFGFVYPKKQVEVLFRAANPAEDHLVLACDLNPDDLYQRTIRETASKDPWTRHTTITGFLPVDEIGRLLAAADAIILPFREGGGEWNTSLHAAIAQGTFVLTTSTERHGYVPTENTYYARPGDVPDIRLSLGTYAGRRIQPALRRYQDAWRDIAAQHIQFYEKILRSEKSNA